MIHGVGKGKGGLCSPGETKKMACVLLCRFSRGATTIHQKVAHFACESGPRLESLGSLTTFGALFLSLSIIGEPEVVSTTGWTGPLWN
jgi:hypothetical protein